MLLFQLKHELEDNFETYMHKIAKFNIHFLINYVKLSNDTL